MNDIEFVKKLKTGDTDAYRELLKELGSKVFNTVISMVQNFEDAEDVTQETFVEVFQSIHGFKGEAKLSTWIYRIAVSKSLEHLRKKNRKKRFGIMKDIMNETILPLTEISDFNHPGVQLENKERSKILFAALDNLPDNQRTAFVLHKMEDVSYAEITEIMQLSVSSVESLMFRAKQNLQKLLADYYEKNKK